MAAEDTSPDSRKRESDVPNHKAFTLLTNVLVKGWRSKTRDLYSKWEPVASLTVERVFGANHPNVTHFKTVWSISPTRNLEMKLHVLLDCLDDLEMQAALEDQESASLAQTDARQGQPILPVQSAQQSKANSSKRIFIVHGHDGELKHATARLVAQLGLEPVILHELSNRGQTIIEKLSAHAKESGFAIVLLTADDTGGAKGIEHSLLQKRARQNVIFEMGLFFGLLGRGKVCAVYESGVEIPSDLSGVVYVKYDSGQWRYDVATEIESAGYVIDRNKIR